MASSISDHEGQGYSNLTRGSNFQCNSAEPFRSRAIAWLANLRGHMHGGSPLPSTPQQDSCRPRPAQGKEMHTKILRATAMSALSLPRRRAIRWLANGRHALRAPTRLITKGGVTTAVVYKVELLLFVKRVLEA
jgi:hypothetical protein